MKHTVCFIDDSIPVSQYGEYFNDTDIISSSVIKYLLKNDNTDWRDDVVKNMCKKLTDEPEKWSVSAFTSPNFYDNYIKETVYAPEIIIYDWDYNYGAGSNESEEYLLRILETSYTMIFIFSGSDHKDDINQIVTKDEYRKYGDRLSVIDKTENDSIEHVFSQIKQKEQNNFSFAYGFEVIRNSNKAINQVLSDISMLSIEDFVASIGEIKDGNNYVSTNEDFIDAIVPRFKSILRTINTLTEISVKKTDAVDLYNLRRTWSFRLYDNVITNKVGLGDIIRNNKNECFLVVSSDCHLHKFQKTNFAFLTLIPMYLCGTDKTLKVMKRNKANVSLSSLTSNKQSAMTILPCVPIGDTFVDYVLMPKGIVSVEIETGQNTTDLLYENLIGFKKVTSLSDPFKTPMIHYIFDNITGYGCPDFPEALKSNLNTKVKHMQS